MRKTTKRPTKVPDETIDHWLLEALIQHGPQKTWQMKAWAPFIGCTRDRIKERLEALERGRLVAREYVAMEGPRTAHIWSLGPEMG